MGPSDSSDLLYKFLFHLRGALSSIMNASQMARQHPEKMPITTLNWFDKWMPVVERWISDEEQSHRLFYDSEEHNWEQLLHDMAENMKDISTAYAEAEKLEVPESGEAEWKILITWVVESATRGCEHLDIVIRSVQSKDYQYLWQH